MIRQLDIPIYDTNVLFLLDVTGEEFAEFLGNEKNKIGMTMSNVDVLQDLCRGYLERLKCIADKHGLGSWIEKVIKDNANKKCEATEDEVEMLSRLCDDERVQRIDIPKILGVSYRHCFDNDIFDKIKKLHHVGIYSKISTILFKAKNKQN